MANTSPKMNWHTLAPHGLTVRVLGDETAMVCPASNSCHENGQPIRSTALGRARGIQTVRMERGAALD